MIQFYSNNATNIRHFTTYSIKMLPHKMAIVLRSQICDVTSPYVYQCRDWWTLAQESPWAPKYWRCKMFCKALVVYRLAQRDEIWHHEGHWCVADLKGFRWTLVRGPAIPCGDLHHSITAALVMVALCNRETIYIFMLWFVLLSSFFFFSPNLSLRRLDVCHTSTHRVGLVRI